MFEWREWRNKRVKWKHEWQEIGAEAEEKFIKWNAMECNKFNVAKRLACHCCKWRSGGSQLKMKFNLNLIFCWCAAPCPRSFNYCTPLQQLLNAHSIIKFHFVFSFFVFAGWSAFAHFIRGLIIELSPAISKNIQSF